MEALILLIGLGAVAYLGWAAVVDAASDGESQFDWSTACGLIGLAAFLALDVIHQSSIVVVARYAALGMIVIGLIPVVKKLLLVRVEHDQKGE